jgi:hypothetical protein
VKKRLQAQVLTNTMSATVQTVRYDGFFHCFKTIYATEGVRGFYRVSSHPRLGGELF